MNPVATWRFRVVASSIQISVAQVDTVQMFAAVPQYAVPHFFMPMTDMTCRKWWKYPCHNGWIFIIYPGSKSGMFRTVFIVWHILFMTVCKSFTEEDEIGDIIHCYHIICFSEYFSIYLLVLYIYNIMNVNIFGGGRTDLSENV